MARKQHRTSVEETPVVTTEGDADEFMRLALLAIDSTSRFEDRRVDNELEALCRRHLDKGEDSDIEAALSRLKEADSPAYDELLAMAEDCAQTRLDPKGAHLLVLIPILGWSRYVIAAGPTDTTALNDLAELYQKHWATPEATVAVGNCLLSADNLPEGLCDIRKLLAALTDGKKKGHVVNIASFLKNDPPPDFADVRYLALSVSAETPEKLFSPLTDDYIAHARRTMDFCLTAREILMTPMAGTRIDVQPPSAFFTGWRQADAAMRVFCLRALVSYVCCMGYNAADIIATTAVFVRMGHEMQSMDTDEVRVGLSLKNQPSAVVAGVVLPTLPEEHEQNQAFAAEVLHDAGINEIVSLPQTFPMEWCEDCGSPLYANSEGYVRHIETPAELDEKTFAPTLN